MPRMWSQYLSLSALPAIIQSTASVALSIAWHLDALAYSNNRMLDDRYLFALAMVINALSIACMGWSIYNRKYVVTVIFLGLFNLAIGLIMPAFYAPSVF